MAACCTYGNMKETVSEKTGLKRGVVHGEGVHFHGNVTGKFSENWSYMRGGLSPRRSFITGSTVFVVADESVRLKKNLFIFLSRLGTRIRAGSVSLSGL